jgi:hypothetical protein
MRRVIGALLVLAVLAVVADRVALAVAQTKLATAVQQDQHLAQRPSVRLSGSPFLTQALSGHYTGGRVAVADLRVDKLRMKTLVVDLIDVRLPLSDLVSGGIRELPVGRVTGTALIAYPDLAAAAGITDLQIRPQGDGLEMRAPIEYLGRTVQLVTSVRVGVQNGKLRMTSGKVQGVPVPATLTRLAFSRLTDAVPLDHLPYGLKLTAIHVTQAGLEVIAVARNAVLRPG